MCTTKVIAGAKTGRMIACNTELEVKGNSEVQRCKKGDG